MVRAGGAGRTSQRRSALAAPAPAARGALNPGGAGRGAQGRGGRTATPGGEPPVPLAPPSSARPVAGGFAASGPPSPRPQVALPHAPGESSPDASPPHPTHPPGTRWRNVERPLSPVPVLERQGWKDWGG